MCLIMLVEILHAHELLVAIKWSRRLLFPRANDRKNSPKTDLYRILLNSWSERQSCKNKQRDDVGVDESKCLWSLCVVTKTLMIFTESRRCILPLIEPRISSFLRLKALPTEASIYLSHTCLHQPFTCMLCLIRKLILIPPWLLPSCADVDARWASIPQSSPWSADLLLATAEHRQLVLFLPSHVFQCIIRCWILDCALAYPIKTSRCESHELIEGFMGHRPLDYKRTRLATGISRAMV